MCNVDFHRSTTSSCCTYSTWTLPQCHAKKLTVMWCSLGVPACCCRYVVLSGYCSVYRDPQQTAAASSSNAPGSPSRRATLEQRRTTLEQRRTTLEQQQAGGASFAGARQLSMRRGSSAATDGAPEGVPLVGQGCVGVLNGTSSRRCTWDVLQVQLDLQQQQVAGEGPGAGAGPGSPSRRGTLERNMSIVGGTPRPANALDINSEWVGCVGGVGGMKSAGSSPQTWGRTDKRWCKIR
jgi:hypothetical protein